MQNNWGRRYDFVTLEADELTSMLHPVFPGREVIAAELLTAGLVNTNYKIRVSGLDEAFVLRIYLRDHEACTRDRAIFEMVEDSVPVPKLLYTHTADENNATTYAVMKWVDGVLFSDILATWEEYDKA